MKVIIPRAVASRLRLQARSLPASERAAGRTEPSGRSAGLCPRLGLTRLPATHSTRGTRPEQHNSGLGSHRPDVQREQGERKLAGISPQRTGMASRDGASEGLLQLRGTVHRGLKARFPLFFRAQASQPQL